MKLKNINGLVIFLGIKLINKKLFLLIFLKLGLIMIKNSVMLKKKSEKKKERAA